MKYCCVKFCRSSNAHEVRFFRFPKENERLTSASRELLKKRRIAWFNAIKFKNSKLTIDFLTDEYKVCSLHFKSGKPSDFRDTTNDDWIPSIDVRPTEEEESPKATHKRHSVMIQADFLKRKKLFHDAESDTREEEEGDSLFEIQVDEPRISKTVDIGTQTDMSFTHIERLENEVSSCKLEESSFTVKYRQKFTYYTGLPNIELFLLILNHVEGFLKSIKVRRLTNFQKLLLTLMKLRLNLDYTDLGYRFSIRQSTVSSIFKRVIICLAHSFPSLIHWPERDALRASMPHCFKSKFGNKVAVIIDCFEIPTQRPSLIRSKVQAYSPYKSRITAKYLLGITAPGSISFISAGWGGRVSDTHITENCGVLDNLLPGDIVLADRGFNIKILVGERHATAEIPDSTRGKKQLSAFEVSNTRKIASVRIHVERVIGSIRNKFKIISFNSAVPVSLLKETYENQSLLDLIVRVTCMLVNLCDSIITD